MSKIIYTPESIKDPKNHARRIYFSCHCDDFGLFEKIRDDIKSIENDCVIAHLDFNGEADTSHLSQLDDFQLVVVPVTENWLSDDGVHSSEFDYVAKQNKAILPILFDAALESAFNEKTENLQFLSIGDKDYHEKLKRALGDILFDSSLIDDVRNVFTHRMFIAYCREDFEYTKKLIRYIHSQEAGKRISIWYDKYLPMGRNFEDSIFNELDNCHIFGMTITPNLLGRENYVKQNEYPRACEDGKVIVPFELVKSNTEDFKEQFKGLEESALTRADSSKQFAKFIRNLLKETKGEKVELSKDQIDYRLGLAYMNGLFVEFDYDYAVKKFESAANADNPEAAHMLGNMYYRGIGVKRDVYTAIYWYKKELKIYKRRVDGAFETVKRNRHLSVNDPATLEILQKLGTAVAEFIASGMDNARIFSTEGSYNEAVKAYTMLQGTIAYYDRVVPILRIGDTFLSEVESDLLKLQRLIGEHQTEQCKVAWEKWYQKYKAEPNNAAYARAMIKSAHNYGFELMLDNELTEAVRIMTEALECEETAKKSRDTYEILTLLYRDIGRSFVMHMANTDMELEGDNIVGYLNVALRMFEKERSLLDRYPFDIQENPYLDFNKTYNTINTGDAYMYADDEYTAADYYISALQEIKKQEERLGDKVDTADYPIVLLQLYSVVYDKITSLSLSDEPYWASNFYLESAIAIYRRFEQVEYYAEHKDKADELMKKLEDSIHRLEEVCENASDNYTGDESE